ncbi:MAG TPA: hypothetical protein VNT02_11225, partial [Burkholderiales bacterium]|nr:hypothetical protein [Burkholderiales bacterium]
MPTARPRPHSRSLHDGRMYGRPALALAAVAMVGLTHQVTAAEGSSLRGLRAPGLIEFAPLDATR